MKQGFYIALFTFLGILLQFLAHALIEVWYIGLLLEDFDTYSFGFSWDFWLWVHHIGGVALFILGATLGYFQGKYWWRKIYA